MTMKNGFSTINRLLGKQRESSSNLSKSTTNLSVTKSTVNINDSSQVHQNRITPLPIATSNAPFEQTFRITVLLPRDQLYVARLGARVRLHKLLQLVCENKQLDADKYEFQHPADPSQIFSCDLTIGAVGLSEIRLCNKSEHNNTLRVDYVTSSRRNSFSSSKFSRNSKNISNTPSLYSSINSLNSMSSSGIDSNFRNISPTETAPPTKSLAPVVPTRKKRLAPRPPSQNLTLEHDEDAASTKTNKSASNASDSHPILKTEFVSTSNLDNSRLEQNVLGTNNNNDDLSKSNISIDCNGNTKGSLQRNNGRCIDEQCQETQRDVLLKSQISLCISSNDDTINSHNSIENVSNINQPEPSPRRKVQTLPPKKSVPVAPPRSTKSSCEMIQETQSEEKVFTELATLKVAPVALPRSISSDNLISQPPIEQLAVNSKNVTKILMNQSPTVESNSALQTTDVKPTPLVESIEVVEVKEPLSDREEPSTPILKEKHKSFIESSSEDDEMIKVYDLKLGKTIVKSLSNHKTSENVGVLPNNESHQPSSVESHEKNYVQSPEKNSVETPKKKEVETPEKNSVQSPDFVDSSEKDVLINISVKSELKNDISTSVLGPQPVKENFESHVPSKQEEEIHSNSLIKENFNKQIEEQRITEEIIKEEKIDVIKCEEMIPQKPEIKQLQEKTTIDERREVKEVKSVNVVNEFNSLPTKTDLQQSQAIPTIPSETRQITVDLEKQDSKVIDDTITNGTQDPNGKQKPLLSTLERLGGDEELGNIQNSKPAIIQQIEIFQETPTQTTKHNLATRSSSFLSLSQFEYQNQRNHTTDDYFSRRRSSSELSIGESPSLQSIGVMKSILNSRKSSLCGSEESNKTPPTECDIQSMDEPSPKSNNIFKTNKIKPSEEKIYRYSGPPNIQFSTWSERPKVQVSIKDEQDCTTIVDGCKSGSGQKSAAATTSIAVSKTDLVLQRNNHQNLNSSTVSADLVKNTQKVVLRENSSSSYSTGKLEMNKPQNSIPAVTIPKFILGSRTSWSVSSSSAAATAATATASSGSNSITQNNRPTTIQPSLRPTSMIQSNSNSVTKETTSQPSFFGQGTLRKTGFKEKIVPLQDTDVDVSKPIPFTLKNNQTKPQITPKTNINSSRTGVPVPTTVPEAPPPPPIIRAVVTKQKTNRPQMTTSLSVDPRDQLLSAIRSFKRDELKNANI